MCCSGREVREDSPLTCVSLAARRDDVAGAHHWLSCEGRAAGGDVLACCVQSGSRWLARW